MLETFAPKLTNGVILPGLLVLLFASGCAPGSSSGSSGGGSSNSALSAPLMVANVAMKSDQVVYASPDLGGLSGSLFIQPRNLMIAPDTQTVGCGQSGSGALGLDSYLSHPDWITQNLLLTEIYVPARNFQLGFPLSTAAGMVPVKSFFALDVVGNFHLAAGETEGDYQFALIADDSARLKISQQGQSVMIVDDEKPAGPNNGCLEQTQASHMSCTQNWKDQSAAQIKTVHLVPGQSVNMELSYWQGPGNGIGMMAFYRKVPTTGSPIDPLCGQEPGFDDGSTALNQVLSTWTPITFSNLSSILM